MRIAVDTGGTFTDCVVQEGSELKVFKVFSTPDDSARAIVEGISQLTGWSEPPEGLEVVHGTTVGTNTLLERRGARIALVTTAGFEDLIEIGRQNRPRLYDFNVQRQPPLVPRQRRWGVLERTGAGGTVLLRPRPAELTRLCRRIKASEVESIALCFLFSFANASNERLVARGLAKLRLPVSVSHEILPEFREYERLSTTVISAYLAPRLGSYLGQLESALNARRRADARVLESAPNVAALSGGRSAPTALNPKSLPAEAQSNISSRRRSTTAPLATRVFVMQSNGGITTAARAAREPVRTILSGPAGGVVAAAWLAKQLGAPRAISFDMGGTSSDVSLLAGAPHTTNETTIDGLPVAVPVIDIHSVGAGGGSLARIDAGGALRVGPESAGALPGPICYGRGGQQPTVTDANLILGRLDQEFFLGGTFRLKLEVTEKAFREFLGRSRLQTRNAPRSLNSPVDLAHGIIAVSNAAMERALRVISVERGHDPRDFILICFGGAGGLHAAALARSLGIPKIVVPRNPGAFSASGILLSDIIKDVSQSVLLAVPDVSERAGDRRPGDHSSRNFHALLHELEGEFTRLTEKVTAELRREYPDSSGRKRRGKLSIDRRIDVRYRGQSYELSIPFSSHFRGQFQQAHQQAYGYSHRGQALEIVNLRVRLIVATPKPKPVSLRPAPFREAPVNRAVLKRKRIWWDTRLQTTTFYTREHLPPFSRIRGPAIIAEYSSTTAVPPDWACQVDRLMNLELTRVA